MRNKLIKKIALAMSFITMLGTLPVNAYELDEHGMSIESVEYQTSIDEDFTNKTSVLAEIGSTYQVTIPKVIVLSGESKSAEYQVSVGGDIAGYETIFVRPDRIVNLYSVNKDIQIGTITQDKTGWTISTINEIGNGLIEANGITAGRWSGTFNFEIFLNLVLGDVVAPDHIEHIPEEIQIENIIEPTCTETGSHDEVLYCTECYNEISRENVVDPARGHDYVVGVCSRCGQMHDHILSDVNFENITLRANGVAETFDEVVYCTDCNREITRETIEVPVAETKSVDVNHIHYGTDGNGCKTSTSSTWNWYLGHGGSHYTGTSVVCGMSEGQVTGSDYGNCNGVKNSGWVKPTYYSHNMVAQTKTCSSCGGKGVKPGSSARCSTCSGNGYVPNGQKCSRCGATSSVGNCSLKTAGYYSSHSHTSACVRTFTHSHTSSCYRDNYASCSVGNSACGSYSTTYYCSHNNEKIGTMKLQQHSRFIKPVFTNTNNENLSIESVKWKFNGDVISESLDAPVRDAGTYTCELTYKDSFSGHIESLTLSTDLTK